ncbi:hypothetical protein GCM10010218_08520 [Streptomyces mashuensis]|uniref:Phosphodiester glycosidase domain-containing protein n=1 Tax=Streptomyces mashuensis TaxID=33904 RepID=A0A919AWW9_9ACTN|nr:hypothetical protein GCM10010218_08520 [Streptomyces mashuensis]
MTVLTAWVSLVGGGTAWAGAGTGQVAARLGAASRVAPGVTYRTVSWHGGHGTTHGHLLTVDLRDDRVSLDLLYPGAVGARDTVSGMTERQGAVGGVNGDFFNITEVQHPGVRETGAPVGPAVADGHALKAAVPDGQRFGPAMPRGVDTEAVFGVDRDGVARMDRLSLEGSVRTEDDDLPLSGFNQYAIPVDGIGVFTPAWGRVSRKRAVCGTDAHRGAPCSDETYEVTVRRGRVAARSARPGKGPIASGSLVLVGREEGARELRRLAVGDRVSVDRYLRARKARGYDFAIGGFPVLRGGRQLSGLDGRTAAVRTAAGLADRGQRVYLLALDGRAAYRPGLTLTELARLMRAVGSVDAFNLDGGGSSTLVTRSPGSGHAVVRNHPSGGAERAVANGIGVFSGS